MEEIVVRLLGLEDSIYELTALLHRAYKRLADMNLRFVATYQDEATTRDRIEGAECYVAQIDGRIVGTIAFRDAEKTEGCPWYDRPEVASFGQFAVEPDLQGRGIGTALLRFIEQRAIESGAAELALDTAEPASHLIDYYSKVGYRIVDRVQWDVTNYVSVIMSKKLA